MTIMDQTGKAVVTTTAAATTTTLATTTGSQQSRGPSKGYSYPVCTTCGRRHPGECRRAAGTCFKCGQTSHLQKDCKKNTAARTSGQADKKPGASGRVFAITEDHATKTSDSVRITHVYRDLPLQFDDKIRAINALPLDMCEFDIILDHVLCVSTPIKDSVRITRVYRDLPLQFDDKIRAINALPLDMCEFDIILGMDWFHEPEFFLSWFPTGKIYADHFCFASTYFTVSWL
nr:hypothetical protein [Tanacetum cinerariifolium]